MRAAPPGVPDALESISRAGAPPQWGAGGPALLLALHGALRAWLRPTLRLVSPPDDVLEPGDELRVRVGVTNTAPAGPTTRVPPVCYRNARLVVRETASATPLKGPVLWIDLPEPYLRPGESSAVEVELVARARMSARFDFLGGLEEVCDVHATADLDQDAFFQIWSSPHNGA